MENIKELLTSLRALDKAFKKNISSNADLSLAEIKIAGEMEYNSVVKDLVHVALKAGDEDVYTIETALNKAFGDKYLSPFFTKIVETYTYQDFPYSIEKKDFTAFIAALKRRQDAPSIEAFLMEFKNKFDTEDAFNNFITREFKPRHPSYYMLLQEKSKIKNSFKIDADVVIENIATVLNTPQIHSKKDHLFCLAMALGLDLKSVLSISSIRLSSAHSVRLTFDRRDQSEEETNSDTTDSKEIKTLCDPVLIFTSWNFIKLNPIKESYAVTKKDDSPERILNAKGFMKRSIPVLHRQLLNHFGLMADDKKNSMSSFEITGTKDIEEIIKRHSEKQGQRLRLVSENLGAHESEIFQRALAFFTENSSTKITVANIQKNIKCKSSESIFIRGLLETALALETSHE